MVKSRGQPTVALPTLGRAIAWGATCGAGVSTLARAADRSTDVEGGAGEGTAGAIEATATGASMAAAPATAFSSTAALSPDALPSIPAGRGVVPPVGWLLSAALGAIGTAWGGAAPLLPRATSTPGACAR